MLVGVGRYAHLYNATKPPLPQRPRHHGVSDADRLNVCGVEQYQKAISLEVACALELVTSGRKKLHQAMHILQSNYECTPRKYKLDRTLDIHMQKIQQPIELLSFAIHQFRVLLSAMSDSWTTSKPEITNMLELVVYDLALALYLMAVHTEQELYTESSIMQAAQMLSATLHLRATPALADHKYLYMIESQSRFDAAVSAAAALTTNSILNPPNSLSNPSSPGRRTTKLPSRRGFSFAVSAPTLPVVKAATSVLPQSIPDSQCSIAIYRRQMDSIARTSVSEGFFRSSHVLWPRPVTLDSNTILSSGNIIGMLVQPGVCKYVSRQHMYSVSSSHLIDW
jgi:hypothetical protein